MSRHDEYNAKNYFQFPSLRMRRDDPVGIKLNQRLEEGSKKGISKNKILAEIIREFFFWRDLHKARLQ